MAKAVFIICVLAALACAVSAERSLLRSLQQVSVSLICEPSSGVAPGQQDTG